MVLTPWREDVFYDGKIVFAVVITGLYILIKLFVKPTISWRRLDNIEWLLATYVLLVLLSTAFSVDSYSSIWGQPYIREGMVSLVLYILIFYLFYQNFKSSPKCLEAVFICAMLITIYGLLQYYNVAVGALVLLRGGWEQRMSTIGSRNFAGTYSMLLLPIACGLYLYKKHLRGIAYAGMLFALLMASKTRSGWIALMVCLLMFFVFSLKTKELMKRWGVLIVVFASIFLVDELYEKRRT